MKNESMPPERARLTSIHAALVAASFATAWLVRWIVPSAHKAMPAIGQSIVVGIGAVTLYLLLQQMRAPLFAPPRSRREETRAQLAVTLVAGVVLFVLGLVLGKPPFSRAILLVFLVFASLSTALVRRTARRGAVAQAEAHRWDVRNGARTFGRGLVLTLREGTRRPVWMAIAAFAVPVLLARVAATVQVLPRFSLTDAVSGLAADALFLAWAGVLAAGLHHAASRSFLARAALFVVLGVLSFAAYANFVVFHTFGVPFTQEVAAILQPGRAQGGWTLVSDAIVLRDLLLVGVLPLGLSCALAWWAGRAEPAAPQGVSLLATLLVLLLGGAAALGIRDGVRLPGSSRLGALGTSFFSDDLPGHVASFMRPRRTGELSDDELRLRALAPLVGLRPPLPGMVAPDPSHPFFHALPRDLCRFGAPEGYPLDCDQKSPPGERRAAARNLVFVHWESVGGFEVHPLSSTFENHTPHFARLAERGVLFTNFYANMEPSDQAISGYLFGSVPLTPAAVRRNPPVRGTALSDALAARGHRIAAVQGSPAEFQGILKSFTAHHVHDFIGRERLRGEGVKPYPWVTAKTNFIQYSDDQVMTRALQWIASHRQERPEQPFSVIVATGTKHYPYSYPPEFGDFQPRTAEWTAHYTERHRSLRYADRELGRFIDALERDGLLEDTIVVVVGDHPPARVLETIPPEVDRTLSQRWVPLLVLGAPELGAPGTRVDTVASQVDLPPTLMELMGSRAPNAFAGRSLLRPAEGLAQCASVAFGGAAFVCPGVFCDERIDGPGRCRTLVGGATVGEPAAEPPGAFEWAHALARYYEYLVQDAGSLAPEWYNHAAWEYANGLLGENVAQTY